jgi:hypothetical protein
VKKHPKGYVLALADWSGELGWCRACQHKKGVSMQDYTHTAIKDVGVCRDAKQGFSRGQPIR